MVPLVAVTVGSGWLVGRTPHAARTTSTAMSAPGSRLIDRHRTGLCSSPAAMVDRVKWKVAIAVGAVAGGALWFARRKSRRAAADAELWAEATDPIARFGDT